MLIHLKLKCFIRNPSRFKRSRVIRSSPWQRTIPSCLLKSCSTSAWGTMAKTCDHWTIEICARIAHKQNNNRKWTVRFLCVCVSNSFVPAGSSLFRLSTTCDLKLFPGQSAMLPLFFVCFPYYASVCSPATNLNFFVLLLVDVFCK